MCSVSASRLNTVDMATYLINCLYLTQTTLALYEFTEDRLEMLKAQVNIVYRTLVLVILKSEQICERTDVTLVNQEMFSPLFCFFIRISCQPPGHTLLNFCEIPNYLLENFA